MANRQKQQTLDAVNAPASDLDQAGGEVAVPATESDDMAADEILQKARAFASPLIDGETLHSGESKMAHAEAAAAILADIGGSGAMQAACFLVYASEYLKQPHEVIAKSFGEGLAGLAVETAKLVKVQRLSRAAQADAEGIDASRQQTENVRKMLLAFSKDLRVVMLRLASRLQTLRFHAASQVVISPKVARESLQVFAPLANRLGIWQIKWEMEDLAFRFLEPDTYREVARMLDEKREKREVDVARLRDSVAASLAKEGIPAQVQGRPKHIYSIVRKMRGKNLAFGQVFDIRALRVVVPEVAQCYAALALIHSLHSPVADEFDDYIARPKANGYQSLHTVVRDAQGQPVEIQIRTQAMHDFAESGTAAHWAYKEAGTKGYAGVSATSAYDSKIAVLRQLLAWERDLSGAPQNSGLFEDRIYVLTPDAAVVELTQGATPVDFAYSIHTNLGHRCRGARINGVMVPLNTALQNGQTVEVTVAKEGGPSRDWLNPGLGYLASPRARSKVRAWFNAQIAHETITRGRDAVEKLLQREGRTAVKLEELASQLGFKSADALFEVVGKDEYSLHSIEAVLRPPVPVAEPDEQALIRKPRSSEAGNQGGILVVGLDSLLTQLARCCKPAPPDQIGGFVTRGKGVSVHRTDCSNFREMAVRNAERVIPVTWSSAAQASESVYPVDVTIGGTDRQGLLRDVLEVFAKEKLNVTGVQTQSVKGAALMSFTVEINDSGKLSRVLDLVKAVEGVRTAKRR